MLEVRAPNVYVWMFLQAYGGTMTRTKVEVDDGLIAQVMRLYGFRTKSEAVDYALRQLARRPHTKEEFLAFEGIGWAGDLDEMRGGDAVR
jgi:Arc/MetJ family transcription regulator